MIAPKLTAPSTAIITHATPIIIYNFLSSIIKQPLFIFIIIWLIKFLKRFGKKYKSFDEI
ncbi:hypothetical protein MARBORIA2_11090 [Methanobrevibacter arboriphilus]|nr:hypothetical protein MARBORIA2_11090 [Methanobrevibacter arboriphilus]